MHNLRILMVHNYYQIRGGEDESTDQEVTLLRKAGHIVEMFSRHNDEIRNYSPLSKAKLFFSCSWSPRSYRQMSQAIDAFKPDVVHVQNFFPLLSPSIFWSCRAKNVPTVFSLRDYRLLCPLAWFFRNGKVCEDCLSGNLSSSLIHRCYHDSFLHTSSVTLMILLHKLFGTWSNKITSFIAISEFVRSKFKEAGFPAERIWTRPNFLETDPGTRNGAKTYAIFVGRISSEKGIQQILEAWTRLRNIPLIIVGDGPLSEWAADFIKENSMSHVTLKGRLGHSEALDLIHGARYLIMASQMCETFGRTLIEAFATATPVLASNLGAFTELVHNGKNGMLFDAYDSENLLTKAQELWSATEKQNDLGENARQQFLTQFSSNQAIKSITDIYEEAIRRNSQQCHKS